MSDTPRDGQLPYQCAGRTHSTQSHVTHRQPNAIRPLTAPVQMHLKYGESRTWLAQRNKGVVKKIKRPYLTDGSQDAQMAAQLVCNGLDWELEAWFGYTRARCACGIRCEGPTTRSQGGGV